MDDPLDVVFLSPEERLAKYLEAMPEDLNVIFRSNFQRKDANQQQEEILHEAFDHIKQIVSAYYTHPNIGPLTNTARVAVWWYEHLPIRDTNSFVDTENKTQEKNP